MTKISALVAARKNSKYLAKFLFGATQYTENKFDTEFLVMASEQDTWNRELFDYFQGQPGLDFFFEDRGLGRAGLHVYFNDLLEHATGDWIVYFCEDHFINPPVVGELEAPSHYWDTIVRRTIAEKNLDPRRPWVIVPKFDNAGTMNHIVSRGFVDLMGGVLGRHGWIDSYINDVLGGSGRGRYHDRVILLNEEIFHDFTHDHPSPMSDAHLQSVTSDAGLLLPKYDSDEVRQLIAADIAKFQEYIQSNERTR